MHVQSVQKYSFFNVLNLKICDPLIAIVIRLLKFPNLDFNGGSLLDYCRNLPGV